MAKSGFLTLRGGKYRGKKIPIPAEGVRPTTDRARAQAFDLLALHFRHADGRARWTNARVLDAFAGTGALGLEALSRGARELIFWDTGGPQCQALTQIIKDLSGAKAKVQITAQSKVQAQVQRQSALTPPPPPGRTPWDLILIDPPYGKNMVQRSLDALRSSGWIGPETLIYAESEQTCAAPEGFKVIEERNNAQSHLRLLRLSLQGD